MHRIKHPSFLLLLLSQKMRAFLLDVYESYASAEYDSGKQAFSMPADASQPTRSTSAASSSQPTQDFSSEAEEIKSILTASFGEGIKFEEVNE